MIFAWANAEATINDPAERADYCGWLEQTIVDVIDLFIKKWKIAWIENVTEVFARVEGFDEWYLSTVLADTAGVTGLELCRRIVGMAQVKDITSISDEKARVRAERFCLTAAKDFIKNRTSFKNGADFLKTLKTSVEKFPRS